ARPLPIGRRVRQYAAGSAFAGLLALAALADGVVARWEGIALLGVYVALVALVWWREREPPAIGELAELDDDEDEDGDESGGEDHGEGGGAAPRWRALAGALVGIGVMTAGGALAVDGAERVVAAFGIADQGVGLTALALATTAELFALVVAALRRDVAEVAVAGVVGSAAYNATVSLGLAAVVRPLGVPGLAPSALTAAALPLVVLLLGRRGRLGRPAGAVLAAGYLVYLAVVLAG
ncbi:MAG: hypothetical protein WAL50_05300, partial [Kineosporiaceae bacterium]